MPSTRLERLCSANRDLAIFLRRADALAHGTDNIDGDDLRAVSRVLETIAPEIAELSKSTSADDALANQFTKYTNQLRALQTVLVQVGCVMLARRAQIESARQHVGGLNNWVAAYRQTA